MSPVIYVLVDVNFGGRKVKQFCKPSLIGNDHKAIASLAQESNFSVLSFLDGFYVVRPDDPGGHSCHVKFNPKGIVTQADQIYRF